MNGFVKLQARFRGERAREVHVKRALRREVFVCPFVASSKHVADTMVAAASIQQGDIVYDLGCGDGQLCLTVAELEVTEVQIFGFDIDNVLVETAKRRCSQYGDMVSIINQDILCVNFGAASVIFTFLVPSCMEVLKDIFRERLNKGTRIVCYKYGLPEWVPVSTFTTEDVLKSNCEERVYLYVVT